MSLGLSRALRVRLGRTFALGPIAFFLAISSCGGSGSGTGKDGGGAGGATTTGPDGGDAAPSDGGDTGGGDGGPHTVGGMVTGLVGSGLVLTSGGQTLPVTHNGRFAFATALAGGTAYTVSVGTQPASPSQTCAVRNATGSVGGADVGTVIVNCSPQQSRYALVADSAGANLATYALDAASGRLTFVDKVATGTTPAAVAIAPSGQWAYVANGDGTVSQLAVGADGTLTPLSPATIAAGTAPRAIAVDSTGRFAYVANSTSNDVTEYSISSGVLTKIGTIAAGMRPSAVAIDPGGQALYVANSGAATLSQFTIGTDGTLAAMASPTVASGGGPSGVAVDPTGRFAYASNATDGTVSMYTVGASGGLTPLTPATAAVAGAPSAIVCDPNGKAVLVTNATGANVTPLAIGADGKLTAMATATTETDPTALAVDGSGQLVFVANRTANSLSQIKIATSGPLNLTLNALPRIAAQGAPVAIAIVPGDSAVVAAAKYAYSANGNDTISEFTVGTDGTLGAAGTLTVTGTGPQFIAATPSGKFAYVANSSGNNVAQYAIGAGGTLTALTPPTVATGLFPITVTVHPSGRFAYALNQSDHNVSQFAIGAGGGLTPLTPATVSVTTAGFPNGMVFDSSGRFGYVVIGSGSVVLLTVASNGTLTAGGSTPTGMEPSAVAIAPTGRYLYVTNGSGNNISQFSIGAAGGLSAITPATVASGTSPAGLIVSPTEKFAYAADGVTSDVFQYSIGDNGGLTALSPSRLAIGTAGTNNPSAIAIDPTGRSVYVTDDIDPGAVWQFTAGTDGKLQAATPPSVAAGALTRYLAIVTAYH